VITRAQALTHIDALAKPRGSLGRLEQVAARLAEVQGTLKVRTKPRQIVLFAADHGVVASGVTAWPSEVTQLMVGTIAAGKAASSVLAKDTGTDLRLVDVGTLGAPLAPAPQFYTHVPVRSGTANLAVGPAMTVEDLSKAWDIGAAEARRAVESGAVILAAGEMGIGNTTSAACLAMLLADAPVDVAVGPGAGADAAVLARKKVVVKDASARAHALLDADPKRAIADVAGLEIAAMAGYYAEAAKAKATIVLDGFISGAAALVAERLAPGTRSHMIAGHLSAEPGHRAVLEKLGVEPVLDWTLRLGEGTGALMAMPMLDAAAAILTQMARLDELGVGRRD
jgi:nicotinate-nucleotide--dimethylbenzimidazole phosphoribosyltransferase